MNIRRQPQMETIHGDIWKDILGHRKMILWDFLNSNSEKINQDGQCRHHSQLTFESQSHPKKGVARTEQRDMTRKARAILVIRKSRLVERKGERVAWM